jgi:hypothetical protein
MFRGDLSAENGAGPNIKPFVGGLMPGGSVSNCEGGRGSGRARLHLDVDADDIQPVVQRVVEGARFQ